MATLESAITVFAPQRFSNNYRFLTKAPDSVKLHASLSSSLSHNYRLLSSKSFSKTRRLCIVLCAALQEAAATEANEQEKAEQTQTINTVKKILCVFNLPWTVSAPDIKNLFGQCGTVSHVELIIKNKDGKGKGYAFVTMGSGEEAQAAVDKFDAHEISGRKIRVEFSKRLKKHPPPTPSPPPSMTRYVIYVSNIAWKARSTHLRDLFTENFKEPVSARVVSLSRGSARPAYGFVSYPTKEEAEAAISALDGKELMGRPLSVKFREEKVKEAGSEKGEDQGYDAQLEES